MRVLYVLKRFVSDVNWQYFPPFCHLSFALTKKSIWPKVKNFNFKAFLSVCVLKGGYGGRRLLFGKTQTPACFLCPVRAVGNACRSVEEKREGMLLAWCVQSPPGGGQEHWHTRHLWEHVSLPEDGFRRTSHPRLPPENGRAPGRGGVVFPSPGGGCQSVCKASFRPSASPGVILDPTHPFWER